MMVHRDFITVLRVRVITMMKKIYLINKIKAQKLKRKKPVLEEKQSKVNEQKLK